jgi:hypothetical protein
MSLNRSWRCSSVSLGLDGGTEGSWEHDGQCYIKRAQTLEAELAQLEALFDAQLRNREHLAQPSEGQMFDAGQPWKGTIDPRQSNDRRQLAPI